MVGDGNVGGGMSPWQYAGIQAGGSLIGNLSDRIFGNADKDRLKRYVGWMRSQMGRDVLPIGDQRQMLLQMIRANQPQMQRYAELVNRRVGLDSGVAQSELMRFNNDFSNSAALDLQRLALQLKSQRDSDLLNNINAAYRSML